MVPGKASDPESWQSQTGAARFTWPLSEFYFLDEEIEAQKEVPRHEASKVVELGFKSGLNDCRNLLPRGRL